MEKENVYIEKDVLGVPASSEDDAKFKAKEQLEFLKKRYIKIKEARKTSGYSSYEVDVEYIDPEEFEFASVSVKDIINIPTSDEEYAKQTAIELLKSKNKEDIKILNVIKSTERENCSVEVEYKELKDGFNNGNKIKEEDARVYIDTFTYGEPQFATEKDFDDNIKQMK